MTRGEKKQKVMLTMQNIKKFSIYEIHNKAVTAIGQHILDNTTQLLQWQVSTAVVSVPVGGYKQ